MGANSELHIRIQDELMNTIHNAEEGHISMLDALIILEEERKHIENSLEIVKSFKDEQFSSIAHEADEYKDGYKGFVVEVRNGGKSYNYKNIPEWQKAEKVKKEVENKYKSMYLAKQAGSTYANISEDDEELPLPEISYRKSSIILKKKKS